MASVLIARIDAIEGVRSVHAADYAQAETALQERAGEFFVAVLDLNLPDAPDGEIIDLVEAHGIPVVVLTGSLDDAKREAMFRRGVADYVVKDSLVGIEYVARLVARLAHSGSTKVLVVDDSRAFREYLGSLLQQHGYTTLSAADGSEGLALLRENPSISLVIADYNMPNMDGLTMVSEMRKLRSHDELAIVAMSDSTKPGLLARFLKSGASDYLNKPFCIEEFYCRIDQNIDMLRSVQRARDAANRDFLTKLYNRRYFFEHAERLHERACAGELEILVAMIDADHFKRINDEFGHQIGDDALIAIAAELRDALDGRGLVARFGGEEFVCLRVLDGDKRPASCLDELRRQISDIELVHEGQRVPITVSIGATGVPGEAIDEMINRALVNRWVNRVPYRADQAVYEAKRAGRNRLVVAD